MLWQEDGVVIGDDQFSVQCSEVMAVLLGIFLQMLWQEDGVVIGDDQLPVQCSEVMRSDAGDIPTDAVARRRSGDRRGSVLSSVQ
jgi:hypothetical protein